MTRWLPHATAAVTLAAIGAALYAVAARSAERRTRLDVKIANAERILYYDVRADRGPRFALTGDTRDIQIVSHAVLPGSIAFDPQRRVLYGLRLRITDGEHPVWERVFYTESRQSKANRTGGLWADENAFSLDESIELTDDRRMRVTLPATVTAGHTLELTAVGDVDLVLARVYEIVPRSSIDIDRKLARLSADQVQRWFASATFVPWALWPRADQRAALRLHARRLAAVGDRGTDYTAHVIYYTGFRLPVEDVPRARPPEVDRHRALAFNVVGPGAVRMTIAPVARDADAPIATVWLRDVTDGTPAPAPIGAVAPGAPPLVHTVSIGPGIHSLHLFTDSPAPLSVIATAESGRPIAEPVRIAGVATPAIVPDVRRFPVYLAHAEAVTAPIVPGTGTLDQLIRVDVRAVGPPGGDAPDRVGVRLAFFDANGAPTGTFDRVVRTEHAPFERLGGMAAEPRPVSEPVALRIIAPPRSARVDVTAGGPAAVRLYAYADDDDELDAPYRDWPVDGARWRYAPRVRRRWLPIVPANAEALAAAGLRATISSQVRLEPRTTGRRGREPATEATVSVRPLGTPPQARIVEPVEAGDRETVAARWPPGTVAYVEPGAARAYDTARGGPQRVSVYYWVDRADVGASITIAVDGVDRVRRRTTATHGRITLPRLAPGHHTIAVAAPASARIAVDRPPVDASGVALARIRRVYALDRAPLRVRVRKPSAAPVAVRAVIYAPERTASPVPALDIAVDGGGPRRVSGRLLPRVTPSRRRVALPPARATQPAAVLETLEGIGFARVVSAPIGSDIIAGAHTVTVANSSGRRLWVRFYTTAEPADDSERMIQWKRSDP